MIYLSSPAYSDRKRDISAEAYQQAANDLKNELRNASGVSDFIANSSNIHKIMKVV
jgi:hypothetical protein